MKFYSDETPGRELVDQARAALAADDLAGATEAGSRLTIKDAFDLARSPGAVEPWSPMGHDATAKLSVHHRPRILIRR